MSDKEHVFMPGEPARARMALQPSMNFPTCGNCGCELDVDAPADSESAPISYSCFECELAWSGNGTPERYEQGGV